MKANMWKNRSTYGNILYRKVKRLYKRYLTEDKKEKPDYHLMFQLSHAIDSTINIQLRNVNKVEEYEMLERVETLKEEVKRELLSSPQEYRSPTQKY